jgi:hypothetical protein
MHFGAFRVFGHHGALTGTLLFVMNLFKNSGDFEDRRLRLMKRRAS